VRPGLHDGHKDRTAHQGGGLDVNDGGEVDHGADRRSKRRRRKRSGGCTLSWMGPTASGRWLLIKANSQVGWGEVCTLKVCDPPCHISNVPIG
jgi:hypothetical protein